MKLVIVESPAKAKTIGRFLGKDYRVVASFGHIRDLPSSADEIPEQYKSKPWARMAVDVDNGFAPIYVVTKESKKHVAELRKEIKEADEIVLATDEDREGESISWHLLETLKPKAPIKRIAFHEITQEAIEEALAHPRTVDEDLVRAQESRRVLDRLFGYSLSPVLWKKVGPKLSAGRVQSVAVRLVVEREEERRAFKRAPYWSIEAQLAGSGIEFEAGLIEWDGKRPAGGKDFDAATGLLKEEALGNVVYLLDGKPLEKARARLEEEPRDEYFVEATDLANRLAGALPWRVERVEQKKTRQKPPPPFITSTLQQAASSILGMAPRQTMQVAQRLYEGVDLGGGEREGLITYMRTDSVTLSEKAIEEAGQVIRATFGDKYHDGPRRYTTRSRNAQEAHEAIRPTHIGHTPESMKQYLSGDELALYRLIWNRTVASQMTDAVLLKTAADIAAAMEGKKAVLRANGSVVVFAGYLRVADTAQKDTELPPLEEGQAILAAQSAGGDALQCNSVKPSEHETQPPGRYTEASLIRRLEEEGIGRPSTYAPTISTIQQRGYVERRGKTLVPTFLAVAVINLLRKHFGEYVDLGFTARMEEALDDISNGEQDWLEFLEKFYRGHGQFGHGLAPQIEEELPRIEFPAIPVGEDTESGEPIVVRVGRNGPFVQRGEGGPENTVTIPEDVTFEELDEEKARKLLAGKAKMNEGVGTDPETGETIYALIGRFGPYVQLGERTEENPKPKRASLPKGTNPQDVSLEQALRLLSLPRELGTHPENGEPITAAIGRYGPYVKCGSEFRSLEEHDDVYTVRLDRALELLAQPKQRRRSTKKVLKELGQHPESEAPVQVCEGRYGPYVTDGKTNATIPKDVDPGAVSLDQAVTMLAEKASKKPARKKKAASKRKAKPKSKAKSSAKPKAKPKPGSESN